MRLGAIFIAVCMVLIAGSAGALVYLALGANPVEAVLVAIAMITALAIYNMVAKQMRASAKFGSQLSELAHGSADLARQVGENGRRLVALENVVKNIPDRSRPGTDHLAAEIDEVGSLIRQLAETVAGHESTLTELARPRWTPAPVQTNPEPPAPIRAVDPAPEKPPVSPAPVTPAPPAGNDRRQEEMLGMMRSAIDANRIDLYLQPIVTLPQRKVRYYEAMSRLRSEQGEVVPAADFVGSAESAGLMPAIDNLVVFRCVQVVRRLLLKNREIGLFCNLSGSTLTDPTVFQQLLEFLEANRAIAPSIVLEFTQNFLRTAGPIENESLSALAERGFRFSLDNLQDLHLEPRELGQRGFRFVKVPAKLLLNRGGTAATDIHPADLSDLLGRFGIDLIAEKIEGEGVVVDLLDCGVRFGQGFLFSPPRPVRAEALQGIADRGDVVVHNVGQKTAAQASTMGLGFVARASSDLTMTEGNNGKRAAGLTQLARRV
jgi:cyclic-di-GMP phosphodiesterase TipF (flagellum assembly factor)